jgi:hypothetical protein
MKMTSVNFKCYALTTLILFASLSAMAARALEKDDVAPMPQTLFDRFDARRPVFLEASLVIGEGGRLKPDAPLRQSAERNLRDFLNQTRINGCVSVHEVFYDYINTPHRTGLASTIDSADFIVESRVVNKSYGFLDGVPGQLLRIRTVAMRKGDKSSARELYYFFIPVADFTTNGVHFCKTDERYTDPPQIGDEVFVFGQHDFVTDQYINTIDEKGFLRALPSGAVQLPKSLRTTEALPLLTEELRRMAAESEARRRVTQ